MKCKKAKNPCKICLATVSKKTGFQCQGKCRQWIHFKCMANPTPGRIQDIKAGVLKIYCPCPDCKANNVAKEFYVDTRGNFTCHKPGCPAKMGPVCGNVSCPGVKPNTNVCDVQGTCSETNTQRRKQMISSCQADIPKVDHINYAGPSCCASEPPIVYINPPICNNPPNFNPQQYNQPPMPITECKNKCYESKKAKKKCVKNGIPCDIDIQEVANTVGQLTHQVGRLLSKLKCQ